MIPTTPAGLMLIWIGYKKQDSCHIEAVCWRSNDPQEVITVSKLENPEALLVSVIYTFWVGECYEFHSILPEDCFLLQNNETGWTRPIRYCRKRTTSPPLIAARFCVIFSGGQSHQGIFSSSAITSSLKRWQVTFAGFPPTMPGEEYLFSH